MQYNPSAWLYPICEDCQKELQYKIPNHDLEIFIAGTMTNRNSILSDSMPCFMCRKGTGYRIYSVTIHKLEFELDPTGLKEKEELEAIKKTLDSLRYMPQSSLNV